ncbi:MAG: tagaturonate reductase, partial [Bacteroidales bacterium]|nr:tagaturonate reductase [Bacteroidales bacterium]
MEKLNRTTAPQAKKYTEKIIQFGEGNFLRAFIEWIIWKTNQKTDFNGSVVVVQPIEKGMVGWLNEQDGLYHLNLQGLQNGQPVDSVDLIDVVSRGLNPYEDFDAYLKLAEQPEIRFVISNTTEAGIAFDPACKFTDKPASSYPGKLTQLLYHRFDYFSGDMSRGLILFPCELIFENGKHLKECILQYIDLWQLGEDFRNWFLNACGVYSTLVDRIVPGYPRDTAEQLCERVGYK